MLGQWLSKWEGGPHTCLPLLISRISKKKEGNDAEEEGQKREEKSGSLECQTFFSTLPLLHHFPL